jgi:hypothetical protein
VFRIGSSRLKRIILDTFIRFGSEGTALEMFVEQNSKNNPSRKRLKEILEMFSFITHRVAIQDLPINLQDYSDVARWPS